VAEELFLAERRLGPHDDIELPQVLLVAELEERDDDADGEREGSCQGENALNRVYYHSGPPGSEPLLIDGLAL